MFILYTINALNFSLSFFIYTILAKPYLSTRLSEKAYFCVGKSKRIRHVYSAVSVHSARWKTVRQKINNKKIEKKMRWIYKKPLIFSNWHSPIFSSVHFFSNSTCAASKFVLNIWKQFCIKQHTSILILFSTIFHIGILSFIWV